MILSYGSCNLTCLSAHHCLILLLLWSHLGLVVLALVLEEPNALPRFSRHRNRDNYIQLYKLLVSCSPIVRTNQLSTTEFCFWFWQIRPMIYAFMQLSWYMVFIVQQSNAMQHTIKIQGRHLYIIIYMQYACMHRSDQRPACKTCINGSPGRARHCGIGDGEIMLVLTR